MKKYGDLWNKVFKYNNLYSAYIKARRGKTGKKYVIEFEKNLKANLIQLQSELILHSYSPKALVTFIIKDPKTRTINKSEFRDRIIHHALCNIIEPILEKSFIYDSYANRVGKGTLKAIERYESFLRKITNNYSGNVYVLKADIKSYFDNVNHEILINIIKTKIKDKEIIWLIRKILSNHETNKGCGMPLGNLTSQFFANVYLNELDNFVKRNLKVEFYIRYVDDFVILETNREILEEYKKQIEIFLKTNLNLILHPQKTKIISLSRGVTFLGLRVFPYYRLLKKSNIRHFKRKINEYYNLFNKNYIAYDDIYVRFEGWYAYSKNANTFELRKSVEDEFRQLFKEQISTLEINRQIKNAEKLKMQI